MSDNIEVRDEIARMAGWSETGSVWSNHLAETDVLFPGSRYGDHPIPNTLDEAAKLPEGWAHIDIQIASESGCGARASHRDWIEVQRDWAKSILDYKGPKSEAASGPTELEARFALRLAVLKHQAAQETKQ